MPGGLAIEAPPRAIWDVLTDYNSLNEYIPNIAASGAVLQPNGRVRIEQVGVISPTLRITTRIVLEVVEEPNRLAAAAAAGARAAWAAWRASVYRAASKFLASDRLRPQARPACCRSRRSRQRSQGRYHARWCFAGR